jgi:hypothetical protein
MFLSDHPSLIEIKKQNDCTNNFVFEKVTTDKVKKIINNINIKKATGADVFIDVLFNLVTKFLCFLNFSQFLLL